MKSDTQIISSLKVSMISSGLSILGRVKNGTLTKGAAIEELLEVGGTLGQVANRLLSHHEAFELLEFINNNVIEKVEPNLTDYPEYGAYDYSYRVLTQSKEELLKASL